MGHFLLLVVSFLIGILEQWHLSWISSFVNREYTGDDFEK